jgi:hypothetical protein
VLSSQHALRASRAPSPYPLFPLSLGYPLPYLLTNPTNPTTDHLSRRVAVSGYQGDLKKPDAASDLKDRIGTGLLALCVGFVGSG